MRILRILHKWLGLIVGLQILLWTVSGFMFVWLDHHKVSGERGLRSPPKPFLAPDVPVVEPETWLRDFGPAEITDVTLLPVLDIWVYRLRLKDRVELRRAEDGKRFEIDERLIRKLSSAHYAGDGA